MAESSRRGLFVIEDAAHAFGSTWRGRPIGAIGDATCFSFDPIKNITCGQGGAIATNNDLTAARCRTMRMLGMVRRNPGQLRGKQYWRYEIASTGFRYHMNDFNAAIGLAQLDHLDDFIARRRTLVRQYDERLRDLPNLTLLERYIDSICPFSYAVRVLDGGRDLLFERLCENGVLPHVHFIPNHLQPAWFDPHVSLPVTEQVADEVISLPLHFGLTDEEQSCVINLVQEFCQDALKKASLGRVRSKYLSLREAV